ncbi:MAG: heme oxygenase [Chryseobacterium sp.]|uniref:heme oxygenase n=1 Tax=Chryseobacterium sp. TaxID=1871047 RepID=UPI0025C208C6|nr:heme oxygenase [Chryseobacterium sp.]MCJ7935901.1 heme oxygenase [Chryseobacterium sp.]
MKTIHIFKFKDSITRKIPFFKEEHRLETLNDFIDFDLMDTEIVTEYIIEIHDDFIFEDTSKDDLLLMCKNAKETIEHYFVVRLNDYDVI